MDATGDNKVFKATDRGHQLTKRMLRGRASLKKKKKRNAIKPPLPKWEKRKCKGIRMITALYSAAFLFSLSKEFTEYHYKVQWIR